MCTKSEAYSPTLQHSTKQNSKILKAHRGSAFCTLRRRLTGRSPCGLRCTVEEPCLVSGSWSGCPAPSGSGVLRAAVQMSRLGPCVPRSAMPVALVTGVRGAAKPRGGWPCEHRPPRGASCAVGAGQLAGWVVVSNSWL